MPSAAAAAKKRKAVEAVSEPDNKRLDHEAIDFTPATLESISNSLDDLCTKVPKIPNDNFVLEDNDINNNGTGNINNNTTTSNGNTVLPRPATKCPYDKVALHQWADDMQAVAEEFQFVTSTISTVTYKWGNDRSGAAEQNLAVLSSETLRSLEQISARISSKINDILAPTTNLLTDKIVKKEMADGTVHKQMYYILSVDDPDYLEYCYTILARNANNMRQLLLSNIVKVKHALRDYIHAQKKDNQTDTRGFHY